MLILNAQIFGDPSAPNQFAGGGGMPVLFASSFNYPAGEWVTWGPPFDFPTRTDSQQATSGLAFDGLGKLASYYITGLPTGKGVTRQLNYSINKRRRITATGVGFLQLQNGGQSPSLSIGLDFDNVGTNAVGHNVTLFRGATVNSAQLVIQQNGVSKASYNVPALAIGDTHTLALELGPWTGSQRLFTAYLDGAAVLTWVSNVAPVAGQTYALVSLSSGNCTVIGNQSSYMGGISVSGFT